MINKPWMLKSPSDENWLTGWSYRKSVTLSRASGAVTNYQMKTVISESNNFAPVGVTGATNTTPLPWVISASSETAPSYAWCAFDSTTNYWRTAFETVTGSLTVDLGAGYEQKLTSYAVTGFETGAETTLRNPKDWTVQGSNNNSDWTTVDTVTGETGWGNFEQRVYVCDSPSATAFRYYKIDITANNGSTQHTGLCELLLLNTAYGCGNKCKTDFSDLRFTTSDGTTLLDYFIESVQGSTPNQLATVWIEFNSIGTDATTFYMYYGKADAAAYSSITATFPFADDFNDASIDTDKWFHWIDNGSEAETGGEFVVTGHASYNAWGAKTKFGTNYAFRGRVKVSNDTTGTDINIFGIDDRSDDGSAVGAGVDQAAIRGVSAAKNWVTSRENTATTTSRTPTFTTYKVAEIRRNSTTSVIFTVDDVVSETITTNVPTDTCGFLIYSNSASTSVYWDWVCVRQYLAVEPAWEAWGAEEAA